MSRTEEDRAAPGAWGARAHLGIMQPYFFPYLGYFQLIHASERWVVFDTPQYIRHGWVNRNRILHPTESWQYVNLPLVKHPRDTPIRSIELKDPAASRKRILGQLEHTRKRAPFHAEVAGLVEEGLRDDERDLTAALVRCLEVCCERLELPFDWRRHSEMDLDLGEIHGPGDWALEISKALGARSYVNPPGGEDIFDPGAFQAAGIELRILEPELRPYDQAGRPFEAGLSILDLFLWNDPETVRGMLDHHQLRTVHAAT